MEQGRVVTLCGQNQPEPYVTEINYGLSAFAGAFRLKEWNKNPEPAPEPKKSNEEIADEVIEGLWGNGQERVDRLTAAGYDYNAIQTIVNDRLAPREPATTGDKVLYTYQEGDTFGQVILDLGLASGHGLWGPDGDVAYYTNQLGITGNIPVGTQLVFTRRVG